KQIAEAEEQKKMRYFISVPHAFYEIEYGLVKGGGRGGNPPSRSQSPGLWVKNSVCSEWVTYFI
ncbi:MAG: hypothetical protein ACQXXC_10310, partial [Methanolinea tarda]